MKIPALVSYYFVVSHNRAVMSQISGGRHKTCECARDGNEINNTGFGVNWYRCVHTPVLNLVAVPLYRYMYVYDVCIERYHRYQTARDPV